MRVCVCLCVAALAAPGLAAPVTNPITGTAPAPASVARLALTGDAATGAPAPPGTPAAARTVAYWTTVDLGALLNTREPARPALLGENLTQPASADLSEIDAWFTLARF